MTRRRSCTRPTWAERSVPCPTSLRLSDVLTSSRMSMGRVAVCLLLQHPHEANGTDSSGQHHHTVGSVDEVARSVFVFWKITIKNLLRFFWGLFSVAFLVHEQRTAFHLPFSQVLLASRGQTGFSPALPLITLCFEYILLLLWIWWWWELWLQSHRCSLMEHRKGYVSKGINKAAFQNLSSRHKMYFPVLSWNTHPVLGKKDS